MFPLLKIRNFLLRKLEKEDAKDLFVYFALDDVTRYMDLPSFSHIDEAAILINIWNERFQLGEGIRWGISRVDNNQVIGTIGYHNWMKEHFKAEIGFELSPSYWRKGIMSSVISSVLSYGFLNMDLNRIEAFTDPDNLASRRLLEKNEFVYEGLSKDAFFEKGKFVDAIIYGVLKRNYMGNKRP